MDIRKVSQTEYLDAVQTNSRFATPELIDDVRLRLPTFQRMESLRETMECFQFDPDLGRAGLLEIYSIEHAKAALDRVGFRVENWHYDRTVGMLLLNLNAGVHEHLSACLHRVYCGTKPPIPDKLAAEKFLEEGLGWFRSASSLGRPLKGRDVKLTFQEKVVFGTDFMVLEPKGNR